MVFLPIASSPISNDYGHVFQITCEIKRDGQMTHEVLCDKILRICGAVISRYREKVYAH